MITRRKEAARVNYRAIKVTEWHTLIISVPEIAFQIDSLNSSHTATQYAGSDKIISLLS